MSKDDLGVAQAAQLQAEAAEALQRGDLDSAQTLTRQALLLITRSQRIKSQTVKAALGGATTRAISLREKSIAALTELNVPSSPKEISSYIEARHAQPFDARALATIRRDEYRSWKSKSTRATYLVPALEGSFFVASRGRLALSHWPLAQRVITPMSARADHLRACRAIAEIARASSDPATRRRITDLLLRYAQSVPGAIDDDWHAKGAAQNIDRVAAAIAAELAVIEHEDVRLRGREAERAARVLNEEQQLWGGELPRALKGAGV